MDDTSTLRSAPSVYSIRDEKDESTTRPNSDLNSSSQQTVTEPMHPKSPSPLPKPSSPPPLPPAPGRRPMTRRELSRAKKTYVLSVLMGSIMLTFIIFGIFSLFWASLYRVPVNTHKATGWVVDFDHGAVGNAITSAVEQLKHSPNLMTWVVKDASEFPGGPEDLAFAVHDQDVWFAVSVNPGATDALNAALADPEQHANYSGTSAVTAYGEEARSENGYRGIFRPQFEAIMQPIAAQFAIDFAARNFSTLSETQANAVIQFAPQLVNRPIYYTINNMRPFDVPVATAVVFVGMIYLLILSFMVAMISFGGREMSGLERTLPIPNLIVLRLVTDFVLYFFLSLFYSLISLAFQTPFDRFFGKGGFMAYWMLQWIGMLALGLALETMMTLLTPRFMPIFLLLWIISDVSVCLLPIDVLPGVFKYGYAMPFYNMGQGIRAIVFGTKNHLGLNFGILFAWIGVSICTLPMSVLFVRWKNARLVARAEAKANLAPRETDTEALPAAKTVESRD